MKFKLALMMFLQFFIWGAWYELGFDYIPKLGFNNDWQLPLVFGAFNIGALVALFFSTQFADRKFAAEKFLALSHLIGGLAMIGLYFIKKEPGEASAPYWPFFFDRVREPPRPGPRVRPGASLGHDRLDRGQLAVHLHPHGLGKGAGVRRRRPRRLARESLRHVC